MTPAKVLKYFKNQLTEYEQTEILDYPQVYFIGGEAMGQKVKGSSQNEHNFGYDDHKGNFKVVEKDHIAFRYEILKFLGKGSFGIAL
jgi:dual specificity tyrosine-phosphorylation-regulated kinase 2/3/4